MLPLVFQRCMLHPTTILACLSIMSFSSCLASTLLTKFIFMQISLPPCTMQVPLHNALPFLEGALWAAGERARGAVLSKHLRRAELLNLRAVLAEQQRR